MTDALTGNSRAITTNQNGIHDDLEKVVVKHLATPFRKPIAPFSEQTFAELTETVEAFLAANPSGQLILDSCCGVGESTIHLAAQNPNALVIGIDKSEHRVEKIEHHMKHKVSNFVILRGDLNDLWRLIAQANWPISKHYLLYPNPWPKAKHLQRRWHGAPVFCYIPKLGQNITVRSNWPIYVQEFAEALKLAGFEPQVSDYQSDEAMTPFERKYWASGQNSTQLTCNFV